MIEFAMASLVCLCILGFVKVILDFFKQPKND